MRFILMSVVIFYRKYLSIYNLRRCRFYPSCSEYTIHALEKHGVMFGLLLSAWRVLRCNPLSKGGYDPVK